ncbi:uncharacterized protein CANTADRAFT_4330 [Suhomyces tanzawaensis NRRL Y-17324]|uniref:SAP domain-containing protein n=1 Tax=Suhomyces tanzawaensis NRRL Y-17324 TaxID=984487 RepID=A0A1E4SS20_9ASCO|nr:uncharacterized protein CANTADRAFT_4330 [Suhomyces tanzawaensis NRRL Y-17324]ODV82319.1 hypothetical protein CANTADRAFT_4330 [Suhomyces tanzawaensis NRRL Y-17324]
MADYASQTVAQLKEVLKSKGLSTDGKKADLVARLTEADANGDELLAVEGETVAEPVAAEAAAPEQTSEAQPAEAVAPAAVADSESTLTVIQPAEEAAKEEPKEEPPKVLTPEERKQLAVDLLQKKVLRAEKFGDEAAAEAAKKDLTRVEKFGVELGTALAREIGLVDRGLNDSKRKFNKNNKFKIFKGKRRH